MVVTQSLKILENEKKLPNLHNVSEQMSPEDRASLVALPELDQDTILAFQRWRASKGKPDTRNQPPKGDQKYTNKRRCPNCGGEDCPVKCPKPSVAIKDRPCWTCGKVGHRNADCPERKTGKAQAVEDGSSAVGEALRAAGLLGTVNADRTLGGFYNVEEHQFKPAKKTYKPTPSQRNLGMFIKEDVKLQNQYSVLAAKRKDGQKPAQNSKFGFKPPVEAGLTSVMPKTPVRTQTGLSSVKPQTSGVVSPPPVTPADVARRETLQHELTELLGENVDFQGLIEAVTDACNGTTNSINTLWDEALEADLEINATESSVEMEVAMDSGATANVAHPNNMPADIVIRPNETDFHFKGANNSKIEKFGECETILTDAAGSSVGCHWNMANVGRPLHSTAVVTGPIEHANKTYKTYCSTTRSASSWHRA